MNIAINKSYDSSSSKLSRYSEIPIYYNTVDEKYFRGMSKWLNNTTSYTIHTIQNPDSLDSLSLHYYGSPLYYWIIADFNRIHNPFKKLKVGEKIMIPDFTGITFD